MRFVVRLARASAGMSNDANSAIMAITTSSSTSVNALASKPNRRLLFERISVSVLLNEFLGEFPTFALSAAVAVFEYAGERDNTQLSCPMRSSKTVDGNLQAVSTQLGDVSHGISNSRVTDGASGWRSTRSKMSTSKGFPMLFPARSSSVV